MARKRPKETKKKRLTKEVLTFVVVVLAVTGYLLYQGATNPPATAEGPTAASAAPNQTLAAGNTLPVVPLISLTGEQLELRFSGGTRPILLFIFSPTCFERKTRGGKRLPTGHPDRLYLRPVGELA